MDNGRYVGLISGTSMDGIDAVAVQLQHAQVQVLAARTTSFSTDVIELLDQARSDPDSFPLAAMARLDAMLGETFADAALAVITEAGLQPGDFQAIGCHGQTLLHKPEGNFPYTLQIGDPWRLAARTGLAVVADFRRADVALGGQGAPLAPLLHRALFHNVHEDRLVANLGGIANLTVLPAAGGLSGFDTGPANCFLDLWYRKHHSGRFDPGGGWAATGRIDADLLASLLDDPYFDRPSPKSTGIEYFNPRWLQERLALHPDIQPADVQATLTELSARTLASAVAGLKGLNPARLIVCGGGVHNRHLITRIEAHLDGLTVESSRNHGLDPDQVEAVLFAWLAQQRLAMRPIATGCVTGARASTLLGAVFQPPEQA